MTEAERLTHLEERYAHLQRHMTEQDKVMLELSDELARLKKDFSQQRALQGNSPVADAPPPSDERPPHY
ncbi:MAG: SlyX family protein [Candidatus Didemnitutus sp.]|nr:SlyX family protein [Candidatus Didemnitutus sp.]